MNLIVHKRQDGVLAAETTHLAIELNRQHKNILKSVRRLKSIPGLENDFIETSYRDCNGKTQTSYWVTKNGFIQLTKTIPHIEVEKSAILAQYDCKDAPTIQKPIDLFENKDFEQELPANEPVKVAAPIAMQEYVELIARIDELGGKISRLSAIEEKLDFIISNGIKAGARPATTERITVKLSNDPISISELAKMLCQSGIDIGEMRLFQWMRDKQFLCAYGSEYNLPRQKYVEQGLFVIRSSRVQLSSGRIIEKNTTKVTVKGQEYFINKFLYEQAQH